MGSGLGPTHTTRCGPDRASIGAFLQVLLAHTPAGRARREPTLFSRRRLLGSRAGIQGAQPIADDVRMRSQSQLHAATERVWVSGRRRLGLFTAAAVAVTALAVAAPGCGSGDGSTAGADPTPEKLDGTPSYEFEQDDLDAAEAASDAVKEYCAGAVSEAQRLGCESHVTEDEIP